MPRLLAAKSKVAVLTVATYFRLCYSVSVSTTNKAALKPKKESELPPLAHTQIDLNSTSFCFVQKVNIAVCYSRLKSRFLLRFKFEVGHSILNYLPICMYLKD